MKKLEELGISPAPWEVIPYTLCGDICFANGETMFMRDKGIEPPRIADARFIAAAPDLYNALREAINSYCEGCNDFVNGDQRCDPCECPARKWRAVLAKASGEEATDGTKH